ncbi:hypothetical protein [Sporosarcina sp. NPDC096371]|uniref:hypothetical protein n=1 Tax=Sporosarcina sp. NPDC096371 TaxID=3364530 RepID=UPI0038054399
MERWYDPDPAGIHSRAAPFNYSHFVSDKNDELLAAGVSTVAFDSEHRKKIFHEWQGNMVEEVPIAPTVYRYNLMGVNKRVVNYPLDSSSENYLPWVLGVSE